MRPESYVSNRDVPVWRWVGGGLGIVIAILGIVFLFQGTDFFLYKTFAPKYEAVRRQTFEQSKAYNQGMVQELQNMAFEYAKATPEQKEALGSIILHRVADYDLDQMPPDLRSFILDLRHKALNPQGDLR